MGFLNFQSSKSFELIYISVRLRAEGRVSLYVRFKVNVKVRVIDGTGTGNRPVRSDRFRPVSVPVVEKLDRLHLW